LRLFLGVALLESVLTHQIHSFWGTFRSFRVFMLKKCKNVTTKKISGIPPCFFKVFFVNYMEFDIITLFLSLQHAHTR
jgi:hypothetical protein